MRDEGMGEAGEPQHMPHWQEASALRYTALREERFNFVIQPGVDITRSGPSGRRGKE